VGGEHKTTGIESAKAVQTTPARRAPQLRSGPVRFFAETLNMAKSCLVPQTPEQQARARARREACARPVPAKIERKATEYRRLIERIGKQRRDRSLDLTFDADDYDWKMGAPVTENIGWANETCRPQTNRELHTMRVAIVSFNYFDVRRDVLSDLAAACRKQADALLNAAKRFEAAAARKSRGVKAARKPRTAKVA
jgi:hypothetical protein